MAESRRDPARLPASQQDPHKSMAMLTDEPQQQSQGHVLCLWRGGEGGSCPEATGSQRGCRPAHSRVQERHGDGHPLLLMPSFPFFPLGFSGPLPLLAPPYLGRMPVPLKGLEAVCRKEVGGVASIKANCPTALRLNPPPRDSKGQKRQVGEGAQLEDPGGQQKGPSVKQSDGQSRLRFLYTGSFIIIDFPQPVIYFAIFCTCLNLTYKETSPLAHTPHDPTPAKFHFCSSRREGAQEPDIHCKIMWGTPSTPVAASGTRHKKADSGNTVKPAGPAGSLEGGAGAQPPNMAAREDKGKPSW